MISLDIPPICRVPNCQEPAQLLSKQGDNRKFMLTCRRHCADMIPKPLTQEQLRI
jgi:hypothetical protein